MAKVIQLVLDDRSYRCAAATLADVTIKEARAIKEHTGMRVPDWERAVTTELHKMDADTFLALAYLVLTRAGEPFDWTSLDDLSALTLVQSFSLVDEPEQPAEPASAAAPPEDGGAAATSPPVAVKRAGNGARSKQPVVVAPG